MSFRCWRCGEALTGMILPASRRESCKACDAEIHVCRMCIHFRPGRLQACAEERAEDVSDRERANFCDYFAPSERAYGTDAGPATAAARRELDALFGGPGEDSGPRTGGARGQGPDAPDRAALDALFEDPDDD